MKLPATGHATEYVDVYTHENTLNQTGQNVYLNEDISVPQPHRSVFKSIQQKQIIKNTLFQFATYAQIFVSAHWYFQHNDCGVQMRMHTADKLDGKSKRKNS